MIAITILARLQPAVDAVCPNSGVCIGDPADKLTWRIDFDPSATDAQKAAAQAVIAAFDPLVLPVPQSVMMWRVKAVLAEMGRLEEIDAAILAMKPTSPSVYFSWEYSSEITRNSPTVLSLGASFGLDLDAIFRAAAAIPI